MPFTLIEPERRPTRPRIDFSVEVRPAPFRPSNVTTSPLRTTRSTPCSTCDSPYQAFTPERERTSSAMGSGPLVMAPHVRLDHLRVRRHFRVGPFGEHRAPLEHRDRVADAGDHAHVVLHHHDRAARGHLLDE